MVNGTGIRPWVALPAAAPRTGGLNAQRSAVFSMVARAVAAPAAPLKRASSNVEPAAVAPTRQSQANAATVDVRQIPAGVGAVSGPAAATTSPFVPVFRTATISDGIQVWGLNSTYFATQQTAQWIANRYGTGQLVEVPFGGSGGPFAASANEYHIKLADGREVNAGIWRGTTSGIRRFYFRAWLIS